MITLADRMKRYEKAGSLHLIRRVPVIVRVDGRAFHSLCRSAEKPFDSRIMLAMSDAAGKLMRAMDGYILAYVQSDEASFLLTDWARLETEPWFAYDLQKIVSISSSLMTAYFGEQYFFESRQCLTPMYATPKIHRAVFDSRAFNIPNEDVSNYFLWRCRDWHRNSVMMFARAYYSHKELEGKKIPEIHDMLHAKGVNWATDTTGRERNGVFIIDKGQEIYEILPKFEHVDNIVQTAFQVMK